MNRANLLSLFLAILWPLLMIGQNDNFTRVSDITSVTKAIADQALATQTLTSSFVQEKHLEMLEEVLISHGEFLFKQENSVRWQYIDPIRYTILIHQGKFTIDNDGKISEFNTDSNPMFREINKMIITAIRGDFVGNTDFAPTYFENDNQYMTRLIPSAKEVQNMIESIAIYFDKESMQVVQVVFSEPAGDYTSIMFTDIQVNSKIADNRFIQE